MAVSQQQPHHDDASSVTGLGPLGPATPQALFQWLEESLTGRTMPMLFVGSIDSHIVSDSTIEALLRACGSLNKWKRVLDTSGTPKPFGFAEYAHMDGLDRALRLLSSTTKTESPRAEIETESTCVLFAKPIVLKIDAATGMQLQKYRELLHMTLTTRNEFSHWGPYLAQVDLQAQDQIRQVLTSVHQTQRDSSSASKSTRDTSTVNDDRPMTLDVIQEQIFAQEQARKEEERHRLVLAYKERLERWEEHEQERSRAMAHSAYLIEEEIRLLNTDTKIPKLPHYKHEFIIAERKRDQLLVQSDIGIPVEDQKASLAESSQLPSKKISSFKLHNNQ